MPQLRLYVRLECGHKKRISWLSADRHFYAAYIKQKIPVYCPYCKERKIPIEITGDL
jgi:hypothetical protein